MEDRIVWLEKERERAVTAVPVAVAPPPIPATPKPEPVQVVAPKPVVAPPPPPPPVKTPEPEPAPAVPWQERMREQVGDEGWEAMVGGSWLNKIGVLVLVIGIALLLGYEFNRVGPMGRVATGVGVSLAMLLSGGLVERRAGYAIFARGLIGGGWAALYFTTFAMHAVAAARVIESPYLATTLLLAVAGGMILHSLKYKSLAVSGLAYFIAFATLALSENTPFSVVALIPLAASLLVLAYRFEWNEMAVFGLLATYATCASRPDVGAPLMTTQALFGSYWLLFEAFDLMGLKRRAEGFTIQYWILPLNAVGFLGLSLVKWDRMAHEHLYLALAGGAGLYLASALIRARLVPASATDNLTRMAEGAYEGPITLSAVLACLSISRGAHGLWINLGLLIEAEILFLAGIRFGEEYLRFLGGAAFCSSLGKLVAFDLANGGTKEIGGRQWMAWTPVTLLMAAIFYVNRALKVMEGKVYSTTAAGLIFLVLGFETQQQYLAVSWLVFAVLLFELGYRSRKDEFLLQSYAVGVFGTAVGIMVNIAVGDPHWTRQWLPIAVCCALHYLIAMRVRFGSSDMVPIPVRWITAGSVCVFSMGLAWKLAPGDYLGVTWLALGTLIFELGLRRLPEQFRRLSPMVLAAGFVNLLHVHIVMAHKGSSIGEPLSLGFAALICFGLTARLYRSMQQRIGDEEREWWRDLNVAAGTLFLMTLAWLKLPAPVVALAWAGMSVVLLEAGFTFALTRFRVIGNIVMAAVFGRLFMANFTNLGNTLYISHRMLTVAPIALAQYYIWARYRESEARENPLVRLYLYAPAILGIALMRFELGRSLAVVGWACFGLALYRTGLIRKIVDLRWQSYFIAALAFWRCWNTNFYIPESLAGISGRVLSGAIVIAAFYCAQLLSPRDSEEGMSGLSGMHAPTIRCWRRSCWPCCCSTKSQAEC